jgi:hypothetical protein
VTVASLDDDDDDDGGGGDDDDDDSCFSISNGRIVGDKNIIYFLKLKILV